ncbi:THAP domain-containing protein 2-like [Ooceraea biroi]|nr:THAP domain-containing protein 2-like [Ooceraea biroi]XP_026826970.1 THAP domain-containing protein 2-like [Ooceraea biroi]
MLEQWLKQIPMKHWTPNKDSLLCSDHFTENCFDKSTFQVRLKSDSVPTCFGDPQTACIICKRKRSHESMHSFFKFPLDKPVLLNRWLENMNLLNWTPTQLSCLCSSHFEVSCLRKVKNKYWSLKENSIPTILNPSDCDPLYQNIEFEKSTENTLHLNENKSTSNSVTNNVSHNVPLINVVITEDAKKKNLQSYEARTSRLAIYRSLGESEVGITHTCVDFYLLFHNRVH